MYMTYMLSMYDILKLKVDVHEALTVGAGWREAALGNRGQGRVANAFSHIFTFFLFPMLIFLLLLFIMV